MLQVTLRWMDSQKNAVGVQRFQAEQDDNGVKKNESSQYE